MPCYLKPSSDTTLYFVSLSSMPFSLSLSLSLFLSNPISCSFSFPSISTSLSVSLHLFCSRSKACFVAIDLSFFISHTLLFYLSTTFSSPPFFSPFFSFLLCLKTFYLPACLVSFFPLSFCDSLNRCKNISKLLLFEIRTEKLFI